MNDPRRMLDGRHKAQLLVMYTILAWATQTLFHQWGFGQDISMPSATAEQFVGVDPSTLVGRTMEIRQDAIILGSTVLLKQVCRWPKDEAASFAPLAELKIAHVPDGAAFRIVDVADIRQVLSDAGVNVAMINFVGATRCTVTRSDAAMDKHQAMEQWIDAQQQPVVPAQDVPADPPVAAPDQTPVQAADTQAITEQSAIHSLKQLLITDLSQRLNISDDDLQITFGQDDQKVLNLAEPTFHFDVEPVRVRNLGTVIWNVTIFSAAADEKKYTIQALAQAWMQQVVVARPLASRQILAADDFTTRRRLVDYLPDQPLLKMEQCVGQQAALDLKPGTVMVGRMVDPIPVIRGGELITMTLRRGSVEIRSVARAMESGAMGQSIKARSETSRDIFDVTVTGPQDAVLGSTAEAQEAADRN